MLSFGSHEYALIPRLKKANKWKKKHGLNIQMCIFGNQWYHYRGFARQPYWMAEQWKLFALERTFCSHGNSHGKNNLLFLPSNMAAMQSFYYRFFLTCYLLLTLAFTVQLNNVLIFNIPLALFSNCKVSGTVQIAFLTLQLDQFQVLWRLQNYRNKVSHPMHRNANWKLMLCERWSGKRSNYHMTWSASVALFLARRLISLSTLVIF